MFLMRHSRIPHLSQSFLQTHSSCDKVSLTCSSCVTTLLLLHSFSVHVWQSFSQKCSRCIAVLQTCLCVLQFPRSPAFTLTRLTRQLVPVASRKNGADTGAWDRCNGRVLKGEEGRSSVAIRVGPHRKICLIQSSWLSTKYSLSNAWNVRHPNFRHSVCRWPSSNTWTPVIQGVSV